MKTYLTALMLFLSFWCNAQNNLDSLYTVWENKLQEDTIKFNALEHLIKSYYEKGSLDSSIVVAKLGIERAAEILGTTNNQQNKNRIKEYKSSFFYAIAVNYYRLGKINEAWIYADSAKSNYSSINNYSGIVKSIKFFGVLCQYESLSDSAMFYYSKSYDLAKAHQDTGTMIIALYNQAGLLMRKQHFNEAEALYLQVKALALASNNRIRVGNAYKGLGNIYYYKSQFIPALNAYSKAIEIFEKEDDTHGLISALSNIALVYKEQGEFETALKYNRKVLKMNIAVNKRKSIADDYISIGVLHSSLNNLDSSIWYYNKALKLHSEIDYKPGIAMSLSNLSWKYSQIDSLDKAIEYGEKSLKMYRELEDQWGEVFTQGQLGLIYLKAGNLPLAKTNGQQAYLLSKKLNLPSAIENAARNYYQILKADGKSTAALAKLEEANQITDSLQNEENKKQTLRTQIQYEYDKKAFADSIVSSEQKHQLDLGYQEKLSNEKTKRNILIFVGILFFIVAIGLFNRNRFIQKARGKLQTEKDRSDNLLLNILPAEIAEELKEKGRADARDFDMVSILFTDFKDFTEASAKLSASELVSEINHCFEAFDGIMEKYKIEKIKTIGDAYMAAGGLPVPTDDSVKNTVLAALEMQDFIVQRRKNKVQRGETAFEMRVGIHTGPVVAGIVGVKKFQYDIWGDTVNTASRMESHGEVGKVNISEATYELLKQDSDFSFESRGKIEVKGKGEIEMYFVKTSL